MAHQLVTVSIDEIEQFVEAHQHWSVDRDALARTFRFDSFVEAFSWMSAVALIAERMNHHPEWSNVYNRISVRLITHQAQGITQLDFELAEAMDRLAACYPS